jgi:hypothetical protein
LWRVAERNADTCRDRYRRPIETTEHGNGELVLEKMNAAQNALDLWCVAAAARCEEPNVKNDAIFLRPRSHSSAFGSKV